jgi:hypothetical protein
LELVSLRGQHLIGAVDYMVYGREIGADGTPHLQGYVEFSSPKRLSAVKMILGQRVHLEQRRGPQDRAIAYCKEGEQSKEEWESQGSKGLLFGLNALVEEFGVPKLGARNSNSSKNLIQNQLVDVRNAIKAGASEQSIYEEHPLVAARFPKYVSKLCSFEKPAIRDNLQVVLLYGPPGSGKTHYCYNRSSNLYAIPIKSGKTTWFDGYCGQDTVLIDDFSGKLGLDELLRLLDKYPVQVECKGGHLWFKPTLIYITTNIDYFAWYDYSTRQDSLKALQRRITTYIKFEIMPTGFKKFYLTDKEWVPHPFLQVNPPSLSVSNVVGEPTLISSSDDDTEQLEDSSETY